MTTTDTSNPLFACEAPPRFDLIRPEHMVPAVRELAPRMLADLAALETRLASGEPTWSTVVTPLTALSEPLRFAWGVINHLKGVRDSTELRQAREAVQGEVVQAFLRLAQSQACYRAMKRLRGGPEWAWLDGTQRRILEAALRDAELSGVGLEGAEKARFQAIALELDELGTLFANHLLDANKAFSLTLTTPDEIAGLPPTLLAQAAQAARTAATAAADPSSPTAPLQMASADADAGPWRITLDGPSYIPFMEHSRRSDLRESLYRGFVTRASSGDTDNLPLVERILRLRDEQARLLGRASYAEVSLAAKMAPSVAAIESLLAELRAAARPKARTELDELTAFARSESGHARLELSLWDVPFWAERLRERRYAYTDEQLRPYFPFARVLDGLFALANRLFGVTVRAADGEAAVWEPSVRFFRIADEAGRDIAAFYLDPYSRPADKRGGAWMDNALDRKRQADGALRLPVAYLVCNQTPPTGDTPSLMTFREVETLFHEFGHGLQHMLTTVEHIEAAGINNVEWDAVELPSQFMENWCYHWPTLERMARHVRTGEALPRELFDKICAARTYRAGAATLRQVYLATLDLELHHRYRPDDEDDEDGVLAVTSRVASENTVLPPLEEDRMLCGFSHIFGGGYAAGYYSYKWAEVLSADAFSAFEEAGLDDAAVVAKTGRRFRDTVLALGGSRHPLEVFTEFRGRGPSPKALLRQTGLVG